MLELYKWYNHTNECINKSMCQYSSVCVCLCVCVWISTSLTFIMVVVKVKMLVTQFCLTLVTYWSEVCQVPVSTELSRKKYWSGRPSPSPGNLPNPGFEHWSPTLWAYYLSSEPLGTPSSGDNYCLYMTEFSSVVQSCLNLCNPMDCNTPRLLCPSPTPRGCSNSWPLSWWCHPTISSSVTPFFCLQSFSASGSFPRSQFFISGTNVLEFQL